MKTYTFPKNRQDKYKARIKFQPISITPVQENLDELEKINEDSIFARISKVFNNLAGLGDLEKLDQEELDQLNSDIDVNAQEGIKAASAKKRVVQVERANEFCYLYVPVSLQFTDSIQLNSPNLGLSGASALAALRSGSGAFAAGRTAIKDATSSLFQALGGVNSDTAALAAQRAASRFIPVVGENVSNAVQLSTQVTVNPVNRTTFGSVNIRSFSFAFKFVPLSREESLEIENIIYWFRKELYPEQIVFANNVPVGYKFPRLFDIRVQYGGTKEFPRYRTIPNMEILPCYLSAVQHNYNASAMTWHQGGKPTEVDMSLTFTEYRPLSKQDVKNARGVGNEAFYGESGLSL